MRRNIALGLTAVVVVFGFWLGEGGSPPWAAAPIVGAFVSAFAVAVVAPGKHWVKAVGGVGMLGLYAVALFLGWLSFTRAFGECIEKGEEVRVLLSEHQKKKGQFPESLSQLQGFGLCGRVLRPTLLEYKKTGNGYELSFKDWLVEYKANESEPFMAHK
jgi:hypothetical protein